MQTVSNRLQQQIMPAQQKISGQRETTSASVGATMGGSKFILPDDVVNLSSDRTLFQNSSVKKNPSVPVSQIERKALRDSFSVYA